MCAEEKYLRDAARAHEAYLRRRSDSRGLKLAIDCERYVLKIFKKTEPGRAPSQFREERVEQIIPANCRNSVCLFDSRV